MKKFFFKAMATLMFAICSLPMLAQMPPQLPVDSAVRVGKLPNGLTYYIRHNETPKGQADFFIAQKVGSALEEDNQRGLAHFLEHMCFNGTKNFPGNSLIDWLETVGVKFGQNLNAYTSIDETVYNISSVPVERKSVQDSCLLILHDWADALLLDPEEIDKERGVIHQEWRRSNTGQMRILENLLPELYPGDRYGYRLPIGTMEVVDNFPPQALRDYYETWYRPDNQGIIVVGDIDPDYIEAKIKDIFSDIEMPAEPKERVYFPVANTPGTIWAIGTDKEMTNQIAMLMFKQDEKLIPQELRNTQVYYMLDFMTNVMEHMLNQRLADIANAPGAPFANAGINIGDFFISKTKDAVMLQVVANGDITPAIAAAYRELLRAARGGFTESEFQRAKDQYLASIEKQYQQRSGCENTSYAREYAKSFIDGDPIPGIELEYEMAKQLSSMIPLEMINKLLPQMITNDNRAFLVMLPEKDGIAVPTKDELTATIAAVDAEDIESFTEEAKAEPLIEKLPKAVAPKKITENAKFGATLLQFPNGVNVYYKQTKFKDGEIVFNASAAGGLSTVPDSRANEVVFMPYAMLTHGLNTYTDSDLRKYLSGKQTSLDVEFDSYTRTLSGTTTPKNLKTLMELIYSTFTGYTISPDEFAASQAKFIGILGQKQSDPQYKFVVNAMKHLYKSPKHRAILTDNIENANLDATLDIIRTMLGAPADYTFAFTGDIDPETFTALASQYIGTLPKANKKTSIKYAPDADNEVITGTTFDEEQLKMETPQTWVFIAVNAEMPYNAKNRLLSTMTAQILSNRLLKKIREEMGAVYSIGAQGSMDRLGNQNFAMQIPFPMKPELKDEVLAEIDSMLKTMSTQVTDDELNPIKEYMLKNYKEALEKNESWAATITNTSLNGVDVFTTQADDIQAITPADIQNFVKQVLDQGNHHTILLTPAE